MEGDKIQVERWWLKGDKGHLIAPDSVCAMSNYGTTRHHPAAAAPKDRGTDYHTTLFRRLSWEGTVPLEIRVDPNELPANSDRGLECYFMQAPRVSYLPLLMPEIRRFLMDVVFDEAAAKVLKEEDWWFECDDGTLLKWLVGPLWSLLSPTVCQALAHRSHLRQPLHPRDNPARLVALGHDGHSLASYPASCIAPNR
jgi:hypothetical protein